MVAAGACVTPATFRQSLKAKAPPAGVSAALQALWWAANDNWDKAHRIVMNGHDQDCAWVHAYLHRVEGDLDNANYWSDRRGANRRRMNYHRNGTKSSRRSSDSAAR
jgi:hypothetical protein